MFPPSLSFPRVFLRHLQKKKLKKHTEISLLSRELATLQIAMPPSAP
jgi:hypothetical protein